jgi:hypothetical protein
MGSFDIKCKLSNVNIVSGDEVYLIPIRQSKYDDRIAIELDKPSPLIYEINHFADLYTLNPIRAKYSDCYKFDVIGENKTIYLIREILNIPQSTSDNDVLLLVTTEYIHEQKEDEDEDESYDNLLPILNKIYGSDFKYSDFSIAQIDFLNRFHIMAIHKEIYENLSKYNHTDSITKPQTQLNEIISKKYIFSLLSDSDIETRKIKMSKNKNFNIDTLKQLLESNIKDSYIKFNLPDTDVDDRRFECLYINIHNSHFNTYATFLDYRYIFDNETLLRYISLGRFFINNNILYGTNTYASCNYEISNKQNGYFENSIKILKESRTVIDFNDGYSLSYLKKHFTPDTRVDIDYMITEICCINQDLYNNTSNEINHFSYTDYIAAIQHIHEFPNYDDIIIFKTFLKYFNLNFLTDDKLSEVLFAELVYKSLLVYYDTYGSIEHFDVNNFTKNITKEITDLYTYTYKNIAAWNYQVAKIFAFLLINHLKQNS